MRSPLHNLENWGFSVVVAAVLCLPVEVSAQHATGSPKAEVQDATHTRIPAASVTVRSIGTSLARQVNSNSQGDFRLDDLMPGRHQPRKRRFSATGKALTPTKLV